ncbi:MAG: ABC transporter substrate-binding protein [Caulobacter sp.]|nr:ABC transporter substrate-binding protein [Vitreoscilla sp.]
MSPLLRLAALAAGLLAAVATQAAEPSVFTFVRTAPFVSLDPMAQFDVPSIDVIEEVYSRLFTTGYLERPIRLEPDLLEAMPTLGADKLTYTFRLRKGVKFHDNACFAGGKGRELTADDVLYSLRRFADARANSLSWSTMAGAVAGLDAFRAATAKAPADADLSALEIAGLHRIDASTFSITLTHENPQFLYVLALAPASIVPVEAVRLYKDRFGVNPVGTGPFMLPGPVDRKATLHLVRNPNYYRTYPATGAPGDAEKGLLKDAGKRLPLVDAIDMPLIEEAQPAALKFLRGEGDWRALDRSNFTKMVLRTPDGQFRLADDYATRFSLYSSVSPSISMLILNMRDPLLGNNKPLRQALAATVDAQAIIDTLYNGRGHRLQSIVPIEMAGNERESGAVGNPHDLARAKKLLADAGYPGGHGLPPITLALPGGDADLHNFFDLLRAQFATVGIQLKADFMDWPAFLKAGAGGKFQISLNGFAAPSPDAAIFFSLLYRGNPGNNFGSYANPAYDKAFEAMRALPDGPQRLGAIRTMNGLIEDDVPMILIHDPVAVGVLQKWVGNFKRNPFAPQLMYLSVDMAAKKKGP